MSTDAFFDYVMTPAAPFSAAGLQVSGPKTPPAKPTDPKKGPKPRDEPVRTQMVGETPDEDVGYDPSTIPVEPIPDDD